MTYTQGTVVRVASKLGPMDMVIVEARWLRRAAGTEYTLAPMGGPVKKGRKSREIFGYRIRLRPGSTPASRFGPPSKTYTKAEIKAALEGHEACRQQVRKIKAERTEVNREAMGDVDWKATTSSYHRTIVTEKIAPGDEIKIKGPHGDHWWATVGKLNPSNGRIGIVRRGGRDFADGPTDPMLARLNQVLGGYGRRRQPREYRWIDARFVLEVRVPRKAMPCTLSDAQKATLKKQGWVQLRFGREFIESSYVVGTTRENARKGVDYEVASATVYHDETAGLFWRATGSFD